MTRQKADSESDFSVLFFANLSELVLGVSVEI